MKNYVFISYSVNDTAYAKEVKQAFDADRIDCRMVVKGSENEMSETPKMIDDCSAFVVLVSDASQNDAMVMRELQYASNKGKKIIPFQIQGCILNERFGLLLSNQQIIPAYENRSGAMEALIGRVKLTVGGFDTAPKNAGAAEHNAIPENEPNKEYVFISYSSKDVDYALEVKRILNLNHIDCWMDQQGGIIGGESYLTAIPQAVDGCSVFVLLLSANSQSSQFVLRELERAVKKEKVVIPVEIESIVLNDSFDFLLSQTQRIHAYINQSSAMESLVNSIKSYLDRPSSDPFRISSDGPVNAGPCPHCRSENTKRVVPNVRRHKTVQRVWLLVIILWSVVPSLYLIISYIAFASNSKVTNSNASFGLFLMLFFVFLLSAVFVLIKIIQKKRFQKKLERGPYILCTKCGWEWKE